MSNFRNWNLAKLNKRFHLERQMQMSLLDEWLKAVYDISETDNYFLHRIQENLSENLFNWNEQELSTGFIGPMLAWVKFTDKHSNLFEERPFSGIVDGEELSGEPDAMIAWGRDEPEKPFFCFKEYKKEIDPSGDPVGQCLAAMLAAQAVNEHRYPVYGIYVAGQNWHFMVLKDRQYAVSPPYSATTEKIQEIYQKLLWLKDTIKGFVQQELALHNDRN